MVVSQHCVESALVALVHAYQLTVCPYLLNMVQKVQNMDISADSNSLRIKEAGEFISTSTHPTSISSLPAVYNAVGLCAFQLYDDLDYDSWYQTHLLKELTICDPR